MTVGITHRECLECGCPYEGHRKQGLYRPCRNADCDCDDYTSPDPDAEFMFESEDDNV